MADPDPAPPLCRPDPCTHTAGHARSALLLLLLELPVIEGTRTIVFNLSKKKGQTHGRIAQRSLHSQGYDEWIPRNISACAPQSNTSLPFQLHNWMQHSRQVLVAVILFCGCDGRRSCDSAIEREGVRLVNLCCRF
ncbi:hypothetical protein PVAP13_4KG189401 [Panicum virgatum]|uniref:Uncharacterized protein n=1 Tax=Panicum virgatum TaxID=38727 RepID=A0A8T0TR71_PANVG|nr:hypothetical protein PVAP13_4KG189401 [Panicum virgatum]